MELLVIIITLALIFDYINGFHDAANSIATIVSTKVLTPFQAVIWAAFFNFVAFFIAKCIIGGFGIANTVSKTVVEQYISLPIILSGGSHSNICVLYADNDLHFKRDWGRNKTLKNSYYNNFSGGKKNGFQ